MRTAITSVTTVVALLLVAALIAAEAQQPANARRVGVFPVGSASGSDQFQELLKAFREGLRDLGWIEGQNVVLVTRWGEGRIDDFPRIASELVAHSVEVIVAWGPQGIRAAQQATGAIPIVMAVVHEPVAFGFVKSLARPGGNITVSCRRSASAGLFEARAISVTSSVVAASALTPCGGWGVGVGVAVSGVPQ